MLKQFKQIGRYFSLLIFAFSLAACGGGGGGGTTPTNNNPGGGVNETPSNSAPTVTAVSITDDNGGSAVVGDSLTGNYTYSDLDSDIEGTSSYRWLRDGVAISGATNSTYTLVAADSGTNITFEVTPVASAGTTNGSAVASSPIATTNSAPTASSVNITDDNAGSAVVGDSMTGNYTYNDIDGDTEGASTYRWLRNGTVIGGATASTYTLVSADGGQSITFEVTPVASTGTTSGSAALSGSIAVDSITPPANIAPTASNVSIADNNGGNAVVGDSLTGNYTYNDAESDAEGTTTFRWLRNGIAIGGAISSTYILVSADSETNITLEVTPVALTGTSTGSTVTSGVLAVINSAPTASAVSITDDNSGSVLVGDSLTGSYSFSDIDNDNEGTSTFRWLRDGIAIGSATNSTYTLVSADSGASITFEVTPVAAAGTTTGSAVISSGFSVINSAPIASNVSTTDDNGGSVVVGDSLTGNYTFSDLDNDVEGTSTFRWLRDGVAIGSATNSAYTLDAADSGASITFEVTPVAAAGTTTGSAVTSTGVNVVNSAPTASNVSISDDNGGSAVVGDSLTSNYTYSDTDGDTEGTSTFRWLRNSVAIGGATNSSYTLVAADSGASITFEVTPVAAAGIITGNAVTSTEISVVNSAPMASSVSITDDNAGNAIVGDSLTGNYTYGDIDNNTEGASTFRWLRDGSAISGATSSIYTLVSADIPTQITFEVTPVAATGTTTGNAVTSTAIATGIPPVISGLARYLDVNANGTNDAGDQLIVPFDQAISVNTANASDLSLPVTGNSFGTGATVSAGPSSNEITVTLGTSPSFKTRLDYTGVTTANSPSGIDLSNSMMPDAIEGASGIDAQASSPIDIIPGFVETLQFIGTGDRYTSVALGDVDGDGDLDMVAAATPKSVFRNDGTGSFTQTTVGSQNSQSVTLGDLDGDGDLDMVAGNIGQGNQVYKNNGGGGFIDSGQSLGTYDSNSIALGDMDGDGDLDMVVANIAGQANRIYKNNGTGTFTAYTAFGSNVSRSVALGDIDGDGDLDVIVANNGANLVWTNNGQGGLTNSGQSLGTSNSWSVALGDVDDDGDLDMVVANWGGNRIYINNGSGSFTDSGQSLGTNTSLSVTLGDVDGDGDLDLVVANDFQNNKVYINNGTGNFTNSGQTFGADVSWDVAMGDVNGDGDLDIVVANGSGDRVGNQVYLNSLSGTWGNTSYSDSGQNLGTGNSYYHALGDIDDDGDLDMVVANNNDPSGNRIYKNNGASIFSDTGQSLGGTNYTVGIDLGDIDGDGDLDMVTANGGNPNRIYTNDGNGVFSDSGQSLGSSSSQAVALRDLDGDGDLDLAVANGGGDQPNRIYLNNGAGIFSDTGQTLGTSFSIDIAIGDIDNDGDLDIVFSNIISGGNRVYINNGTAGFSDSGQSLGNSDSDSIDLGDIDNDGDLDIVVGNRSNSPNKVYINDGLGTFTNSTQSIGVYSSHDITLGDIDNDGDLDIVVANLVQGNRIYTNNGSGVFSYTGQALGTNRSLCVKLGDLDGDGDLDISITNINDVPNRIYLNQ